MLAPSSPTPSSANILTGTSVLNTLLTAGAQYWVIAEFVAAYTWADWNYGSRSTLGRHVTSTDGGQTWNSYASVPLGALDIDATAVPITTVPEPTTLGLLGAALLGFGLFRRRRRAS